MTTQPPPATGEPTAPELGDPETPDTGEPENNEVPPDPGRRERRDRLAERDAEAEKWKSLSRKHEERAKANEAKLRELELAAMSDQERAVAEAREQARAEALREVAADRVTDLVRAKADGRVADIDTLLDGLNPEKFIGEDGKPDVAKLTSWLDAVAPKVAEDPTPATPQWPDLGQGNRGGTPSTSANPLLDVAQRLVG